MGVIGRYDPLTVRRLDALNAALDALGYTGSRVFDAATPTVNIDPPDAQAQSLIDSHDWTAAGDLDTQRAAAVGLAGGGSDPIAIGTRAMTAFAATRDNDQAEAFAALLDLLGITPEQLAERIALRRQTVPATPGAPDPAGVVLSATTRFDGAAVLGTIAGYIAAGAGDPPNPPMNSNNG